MTQALRPTGAKGFVLLAGAALLALALLALAALGAAFWWYSRDLPTLEAVTAYQPRQSMQVFTADGVEIAEYGGEHRRFVPIAEVPKTMRDAVVSIEDHRFFEHRGIDFIGLARAVVANLSGGVTQGASTITQQVARNFFLTHRFTPERKIKEAMLALRIEASLSKEQILELYLNQIWLGQRSYGFAAAARGYFGKSLPELTLAETALLAGLPQNPGYANPVASPARAIRRQRIVLRRMRELGVIDEVQQTAALAQRLEFRRATQVELHAEHVADMARQIVVQRLGERAYVDGIRVQTSLVADEQRVARAALRRAILAHERRQPYRGEEAHAALPEIGSEATLIERAAAQALREHRDDEDLRVGIVIAAASQLITVQLVGGEQVPVAGDGLRWARPALERKTRDAPLLRRGSIVRIVKDGPRWAIAQWPQADGAFVALDPLTGRVRALVGGFDFGRSQFNRVTRAWRQPGSSLKPLLYSAAIEHGVMPETLIADTPWNGDNPDPKAWHPKNSDGRYEDAVTLRQALAKSKNMVSIRLVEKIGVGPMREALGNFGLDAAKHPENLTLALGSGSVTPLQMAAAYGVLANGGYRLDPVVIERITDARGNLIYETPAATRVGEDRRVISERNAFVVTSLLQEVTRSGTAAKAQAQLKRGDLYGKTGTTNDAVDAWFAGFQPSVVAVAWIGHDDPQPLGEGESGGGLALPVWIEFMASVLRNVPEAELRAPEGLLHGEHGLRDWRYAEWAEALPVPTIGLPPPSPDPIDTTPRN